MRLPGATLAATLVLSALAVPICEAHHAGVGVPVRSVKCGWLEGESVRDARNVAEFCARSVENGTRISGVTSDRERLWIEAPPQLAADVKNGVAAAGLLAAWLKEWRRITGFRTATVSLVVNHIDVASAQTTMRGDVIVVR